MVARLHKLLLQELDLERELIALLLQRFEDFLRHTLGLERDQPRDSLVLVGRESAVGQRRCDALPRGIAAASASLCRRGTEGSSVGREPTALGSGMAQ